MKLFRLKNNSIINLEQVRDIDLDSRRVYFDDEYWFALEQDEFEVLMEKLIPYFV